MTKKNLLLLTIFLVSVVLWAQTPERISYQAVVRVGDQNTLVTNAACGVQISILQQNENGSAVYVEQHTATTNANGLLTLAIGGGTVQSGSFKAIDWANGPYFVKTEIDPNGGTIYLISSTTQLLTVPYALHSKTAETVSGTVAFEKITGVPAGFSGDYNALENKPELFSGNYSDLSGKPTLFSGNYADLAGKPTLANVATSGSYNDLTDKPVIGENGFSGNYADLSGKPNIKDSIETFGFDGNYSSLVNAPMLFSGNYDDLTGKPTLAPVATTGSYNDLTDKPVIGENGFSGDYADLSGKPNIKDSIAVFGFSGEYDDLKNKPTLFSGSYNDLIDKPVIEGNDFSGIYSDLIDLPNIKDSILLYGFDGDYNALINSPINVSAFNNDANYVTRDEIGSTVPLGNNNGDMLYWQGNKWQHLPVGTEGQILSIAGGKPTWIDFDNAKNTYKVGDIYLKDNMSAGVIADISADGESGIIVSFDEYASLTWGRNDTLINSINPDGYANTNIARAVWNYNETTYPAFNACVDLGADEWYLPSKEELAKVYQNRNEINVRLQSINATLLGASSYWTSTETDNENAYLMQFSTVGTNFAGTAYSEKKNNPITVRAIRKLTKTEINSRPDNYRFYKIGDIYYENNVPTGVVYEISDGGLHGKMIALTQERKSWSVADPQVVTGAVSEDNGLENQNSILANVEFDNTLFNFPPDYNICMSNGWYVPAKNELIAIYAQKDILNITLNQLILQQVSDVATLDVSERETKFYWSSTEKDAANAYGISFENGNAEDTLKSTNRYIRGIRNF